MRRLSGAGSLVALAVSCAVFPDHAPRLSTSEAGAGGALPLTGGGGGAAGDAEAGDGGTRAQAGGMPIAGSPMGGNSTGGGDAMAGAEAIAGMAGAAGCLTTQRTLEVAADTWIDSAKPSTGNGSDQQLWVVSGPEERRALVAVTLPAAVRDLTVVRATLQLKLESNADENLMARQLEVRRLDQAVDESRTTWNNYATGAAGRWAAPGGDFGPPLATATILALTNQGTITFDLSSAWSELLSPGAIPLSLIVLEVGPAPTSPAELAFTSREGDDSWSAFTIEYCQ